MAQERDFIRESFVAFLNEMAARPATSQVCPRCGSSMQFRTATFILGDDTKNLWDIPLAFCNVCNPGGPCSGK